MDIMECSGQLARRANMPVMEIIIPYVFLFHLVQRSCLLEANLHFNGTKLLRRILQDMTQNR